MKTNSNPKHERWIIGQKAIGDKIIPLVDSKLTIHDQAGAAMVRLGFNRNHYRIKPGLYAVGNPDEKSPVLVSANYKLSFDFLRKELNGLDSWILVLDTKGVNVWCAAGKGTFGTKELVQRIIDSNLAQIVSHRTVIVPQLGATGVAGHKIKSFTKFNVVFGPVRASDLQLFLKSNLHKSPEMRQVDFNFIDRIKLIPVDVVGAWPVLAAIAFFLILDYFYLKEFSWRWFGKSILDFVPLFGAVIAGSALVPALLPWVPFKAFSLKGLILGILWFIPVYFIFHLSLWNAAATFLMITSISSFFAMNFTGASTFTCLSGAELEVKKGTPLMITALFAAIVLKVLISFKVII